jgi:hypothetical protein
MMADNYKILAQNTAESIEEVSGENQANILYTVPENTQASVSSISLINTAEENVEYSLGVVKAEDVESSTEEVESTEAFPRLLALVANGNGLPYSNDGESWIMQPFERTPFRGAYGNGRFVVSDFGVNSGSLNYRTQYSDDGGSTWSATPLPPSEGLFIGIAYGNGKFVMIPERGEDGILYSLDGSAWERGNDNPDFLGAASVVFGDEKFIAFSFGLAFVSTDGVSWSTQNLPESVLYSQAAFGNGRFVAISSTNNFSFSKVAVSEGNGWTSSVMPASGDGTWVISYGNGKFVAVATGISNVTAHSTDGITWTQETISVPNFNSSASISDLAFANGKFFLLFTSKQELLSSVDGINWAISGTIPVNNGMFNFYKLVVGEALVPTKVAIQNIDQSQTIIPTRLIEPNAVDEIVGGITLSEGDQIRIYSESPDLIAQVYGVEIA